MFKRSVLSIPVFLTFRICGQFGEVAADGGNALSDTALEDSFSSQMKIANLNMNFLPDSALQHSFLTKPEIGYRYVRDIGFKDFISVNSEQMERKSHLKMQSKHPRPRLMLHNKTGKVRKENSDRGLDDAAARADISESEPFTVVMATSNTPQQETPFSISSTAALMEMLSTNMTTVATSPQNNSSAPVFPSSSAAGLSNYSTAVGIQPTLSSASPNSTVAPTPQPTSIMTLPGLESMGPVTVIYPTMTLGVPSETNETVYNPVPDVTIIIPPHTWVSSRRATPQPLTMTVFLLPDGLSVLGATSERLSDARLCWQLTNSATGTGRTAWGSGPGVRNVSGQQSVETRSARWDSCNLQEPSHPESETRLRQPSVGSQC